MDIPQKDLRPALERFVGLSKEQIREQLRNDLLATGLEVTAQHRQPFTIPPPPTITVTETTLHGKGLRHTPTPAMTDKPASGVLTLFTVFNGSVTLCEFNGRVLV